MPPVRVFRLATRAAFALLVVAALGERLLGFPSLAAGALMTLAGSVFCAAGAALLANARGVADAVRSADFPPGIYFGLGGAPIRRRADRAAHARIAGACGVLVGGAIAVLGVAVAAGMP